MKFDICDFYPSISEELLDIAVAYAKLHTEVTDEEVRVIKHTRKSLLFSQNAEWIKKTLMVTFLTSLWGALMVRSTANLLVFTC